MTKFFIFLSFFSTVLFSQEFHVRNFENLIRSMPGWEEVLQDHFKLYEGYVKQCNFLDAELKTLQMAEQISPTETFVFQSIKRQFGWEFDSMIFHELYFENLGSNGVLSKDKYLYQELERQFGSYQQWYDNFKNTCLVRGIGWAILYLDPTNGQLYNAWISDHSRGLLAGDVPLLVIDCWEHAYLCKYGIDRAKYVEQIMQFVNWDIVTRRREACR